jgi:hypothetical protein
VKKIFLFFCFMIFLSGISLAQPIPGRLNIAEEDGDPSCFPYKLKVTNGTLTNNNDGTCSLAIGGGSTYSAGGILLNLTGTVFSVKEGTLTTTKGCKYVSGTGLVCDQDYQGASPDTKCINIDPVSTTTDWFMWKAPVALTITHVNCIVDAATSVVLTARHCNANGASCTTIEAAMTCATTNTTESGGIDSGSITAGETIRVTRGTVTGSPTQAFICFDYTKP